MDQNKANKDIQAGSPPDVSLSKVKKTGIKKWLPAIIGGSVFVLLVVGGIIGYVIYQSPKNVLNSALSGVLKNNVDQGHLMLSVDTADGVKVKADMHVKAKDGKGMAEGSISVDNSGQQVNLDVGFASSENEIFFKVAKLQQLISDLGYSDQIDAYGAGSIISSVDGKWIKVTEDDIQQLSAMSGMTAGDDSSSTQSAQCFQDLQKTLLQEDNTDRKQMSKLYLKHPIFSVIEQHDNETINGVNSYHYTVDFSEKNAVEFAREVVKLDSFKKLQDCTGEDMVAELDKASTERDEVDRPTFDVWIGKWNHKVTRFQIGSNKDSSDKVTFTYEPDYKKLTELTMPADAKSIQDIMTELQTTMMGGTGA